MSIPWILKYEPKNTDEFIGNSSIVEHVKGWAEAWLKGKKQKPIMLTGPIGVGKTALAVALAREYCFELLEINASDDRDAKRINRTIGLASVSRTLSGRMRLILIDEVDGLYAQDRGASSAIIKILKEAECPVILTAVDEYNQKIAQIKKHCEVLKMKKIHYATIAKRLAFIIEKEGIKAPREILIEIARQSNGDVRAAINDLQLLATDKKEIKEEDLELLSERNKEQSIFNSIIHLLKTNDYTKAREEVKKLSEPPDFILKWVEENIPREYKDPEDLARAMEVISRADLMLGRVSNNQSYVFWKYALDLIASVSISKRKKYSGFVKYSFPSLIKYLSKSKTERTMRKQIAAKIGRVCHVSTSTAVSDYLPLIMEWMKTKPEEPTAVFEFDEEELKFFRVKNPAKVIEKAAKLRKAERKTVKGISSYF